MNEPVPKLSPRLLSIYVADLLLAGAGESESVIHDETRRAWHWFFGALIIFFIWFLVSRWIVIPSFHGEINVYKTIRMIEAFAYLLLLLSLGLVAVSHYRHILVPKRSVRFVTLSFFFVFAIVLFARFYYSVFHVKPEWFHLTDSAIIPSIAFGVDGIQDLIAFGEFVIFSSCAMLNCTFSNVSPKSVIIAGFALFQLILGLLFVAIVVATFVRHATEPDKNLNTLTQFDKAKNKRPGRT